MVIPSFSSMGNAQETAVNNEQETTSDSVQSSEENIPDEKQIDVPIYPCKQKNPSEQDTHSCGIPLLPDAKNKCYAEQDMIIPNDDKGSTPIKIRDDLPSEFSWKNYQGQDWTTPARSQVHGLDGLSCVKFSAVGALEATINIVENNSLIDLDLSEQYLMSCLPPPGEADVVYNQIMHGTVDGQQRNGITFEACFPYQADWTIPCSAKSSDWAEYLVPISGYGYQWHPTSRDVYKSQLITGGPVVSGIALPTDGFEMWVDTHHEPTDVYYEDYCGDGLSHAVIIVGYKDDSSLPGGGYWICKNSYGPDCGYEGFFNIGYGCLNIDTEYIAWVTFESAPILIARFQFTPTFPLEIDDVIQFTDTSFDLSDNITSWHWDFGDGTNSTEQHPQHSYIENGLYTVTLTVENSTGKTDSVSHTLRIGPPGTLYVGGEGPGNFSTIQDGIDTAYFSDTVFVYPDIYHEHLQIDKNISLMGENNELTIIDGDGIGNVVTISANGVTISGFTIQHSESITFYEQFGGIYCDLNSNYNCITNNKIQENYYGIYFLRSSYNFISQNTIINNNASGIALSSVNGIVLSSGSVNNTVSQNIIQGNQNSGISIYYCTDNTISGNIIADNRGHGIDLWGLCSQNIIYHNNFINNNPNAHDECNNTWYNTELQEGNYWSDLVSNPGFPECYIIPGGDNVDLYPHVGAWINGPDQGFVGEPIQFTGLAGGGKKPYSYNWSFGDGNSSYEQNPPVHQYTLMGTYTVTLMVTDDIGHQATDTTTIHIFPTAMYVDDNYNQTTPGWFIDHFNRIQDAINASGDHTPIYVSCGVYTEQLKIRKSVHLIGEQTNETNITGSGKLVDILAENVSIQGFTIYGGDYGIYIQSSRNILISGNIINGNSFGITLYTSNSNTFSGNTINNYYGIYLSSSNSNTFSGNTINNNYQGIYLYSSNSNTFSGNTINDNKGKGIYLCSSSSNNNIIGNDICRNTGKGIFISSSSKNNISKNTITNNIYGIHLDSSSMYNSISMNIISNNTLYGLYLTQCTNNTIFYNNFINNTQNAYDTGSNTWYNITFHEGNYWSNFDEPSEGAYDNDSDGIIDTPYTIAGGNYKDYYPLIRPWPQIPGDLDHDDDIDQDDFAIFQQALGHSFDDPLYNPEADYNNNGVVDLVDYQIWLLYYRDFVASHTDILINGITANYITGDSTNFSAEHDTATKIKLTATIKNNGTINITTPFQVSFYGINEQDDAHARLVRIGTVEITHLLIGRTAEATLLWRPQPEIQTVLAIADSSRIIKENNENNNEMSIKLPSYPLWKCLTETQEIYKKLNEQYKVPSSEKIIALTDEAVSLEVYVNPQEYLEVMKGIAGLEFQVSDELKGQVHDDLLEKYQEMVKQLLDRIVSSSETSWDDAAAVAELQVQICKHVKQMMT
ncbi:MAG: right-handed parallel beta-helix repeat-containing protein [Euryarchaeota archaeon]|nr:right-handed parallel beta-helix repeat-containing protein [Euryarchaeota archaeon]